MQTQVNRIAGFMFNKYKVECCICGGLSTCFDPSWEYAAQFFSDAGWRVILLHGEHKIACPNCKEKGVIL